MALLRWLPLALLASCYGPDLSNCTVACTSEADCGSGQVCGSDRFCAAPEIAGRCSALPDPSTDAAVSSPDAVVPVSDASHLVAFRVVIVGSGSVELVGHGTCDSANAVLDECSYPVIAGGALTVRAMPHSGSRFDRWEGVCIGQDSICLTTPTVAVTTATAKFKHDNDD